MNINSYLTFSFVSFKYCLEAETLYLDETTCNTYIAESQHAKDTNDMGPGILNVLCPPPEQDLKHKGFPDGGFKFQTYILSPPVEMIQFGLKPPTLHHLS